MTQCFQDYRPAENALADRVILVTGAGGGIGRAVSKALGQYGATVVLQGRTVSKLESVYDEILEAGGPTPAIYPMDFEGANWQDYLDMADRIDEEFGRLDGLLNNAGILGDRTPISQYDIQTWIRVMHVNLNAYFFLTQACYPVLDKSQDASVVFTSSGVGRKGRAYWGAYSVSKVGTEGLMQVFADEVDNKGNMRANSINPGGTRTSMRAEAFPGEDPNTLPTPEDIVGTYLYVLGPDGKELNGEMLDAQQK